ncbi:MAG: SMP-30/gluconolactonase/LRE family protein [Armatimonadota bacterium]|nr:MAG: SMP-30/gluconolactonase/LRE family protein [Armatimonadota bacterium]
MSIEIIDEAFQRLLAQDSAVRLIADGFQFAEGPTWVENGQFLLFSDIPADTIFRWSADRGVEIWRRPSRHANGNTVDREGRVVTCEHRSRSLTRTENDGAVTTLASTYHGRKLNSPNDVVVKRDGSIWFTDPPYGIKSEQAEQPANYVFRLDPGAPEPVPVADDFSRPNGLCFSPDEHFLYIADSDHETHHLRRFEVRPDGYLDGGDVFATINPGIPDGIRTDRTGRLYSAAGDGVHVFSPDGELLGKFRTPQTASNCAFGGQAHSTLFITAVSSLWAVDLNPSINQP